MEGKFIVLISKSFIYLFIIFSGLHSDRNYVNFACHTYPLNPFFLFTIFYLKSTIRIPSTHNIVCSVFWGDFLCRILAMLNKTIQCYDQIKYSYFYVFALLFNYANDRITSGIYKQFLNIHSNVNLLGNNSLRFTQNVLLLTVKPIESRLWEFNLQTTRTTAGISSLMHVKPVHISSGYLLCVSFRYIYVFVTIRSPKGVYFFQFALLDAGMIKSIYFYNYNNHI